MWERFLAGYEVFFLYDSELEAQLERAVKAGEVRYNLTLLTMRGFVAVRLG